jgi:Mrp family chromosome partitioning ATPase
MRDLLKRLSPGFDVIILDTPPVLVSADAAILAPLADGVILVVRAGETERHAIEHGYEQLTTAGGHVLGVVLNDPAGEIPKYDRYYYAYEEKAEEAS